MNRASHAARVCVRLRGSALLMLGEGEGEGEGATLEQALAFSKKSAVSNALLAALAAHVIVRFTSGKVVVHALHGGAAPGAENAGNAASTLLAAGAKRPAAPYAAGSGRHGPVQRELHGVLPRDRATPLPTEVD